MKPLEGRHWFRPPEAAASETREGETDRILSHAHAPLRTDSESVETTVRRRRILFAGFVAPMGEERLPRRAMFGEMLGGKGYSGG